MTPCVIQFIFILLFIHGCGVRTKMIKTVIVQILLDLIVFDSDEYIQRLYILNLALALTLWLNLSPASV